MSPFTRAFIKVAKAKETPTSNFPQDRDYYEVGEGGKARLKRAGISALTGGVTGASLGSMVGLFEAVGSARNPKTTALRHALKHMGLGAVVGAGVLGPVRGGLSLAFPKKKIISYGAKAPEDKKQEYLSMLKAKGYRIKKTDMPGPF